LAEPILNAAKAGERDPAKPRARAITERIEGGLQTAGVLMRSLACHSLRLDRDLVANILDTS
jgi:hypothetical protein